MLDILRKNATSWVTKFILGLICVVFIFFFGSSSMRSVNQASQTLVEVDGYPITEVDLNGYFKLQKDNNPYLANIDDSFIEIYKQSLLDQLINTKLSVDKSFDLGFRISDQALAETIKENPNLQKDGKFDFKTYHDNLLPYYQKVYHINYEKNVRDSLLIEKLQDVFSNANFVSSKTARLLYQEGIRIKVDKIEISEEKIASSYQPTEEEISQKITQLKESPVTYDESEIRDVAIEEIKDNYGENEAPKIAKELWNKFKANKLTDKELEKYSLKKREVAFFGIHETDRLIPKLDDPETIKKLFKLTKNNPYPDGIIDQDDKYYLIKLIDKEVPNQTKFAEDKEQIIERLENFNTNQFYKWWFEDYKSKSKIDFNS